MRLLTFPRMLRRGAVPFCALACGAGAGFGQSINIDICPPGFVAPTAGYAAAADQPGFWNSVNPFAVDVMLPLAGLGGGAAVATVEITMGAGGAFFNNAGTDGDDELLMDDIQAVGAAGATSTYTFDGLDSGAYWIYTYAWAPASAASETKVEVALSDDPAQVVGGAWPADDEHEYLVTFSKHFVVLPFGADLEVVVTTIAGVGAVNGFQLVYFGTHGCHGEIDTYCTAKTNSSGCTPTIGSLAGPPSAGACGCPFVITAWNVLDNKSGLLFYSVTGPAEAPFHGGTLCAAPPLMRTPLQNSGGIAPCGGTYGYDFNVRIASGVDPALVPGQGVWAQWYTRDPGFPAPDNVGLTDAINFTICF